MQLYYFTSVTLFQTDQLTLKGRVKIQTNFSF